MGWVRARRLYSLVFDSSPLNTKGTEICSPQGVRKDNARRHRVVDRAVGSGFIDRYLWPFQPRRWPRRIPVGTVRGIGIRVAWLGCGVATRRWSRVWWLTTKTQRARRALTTEGTESTEGVGMEIVAVRVAEEKYFFGRSGNLPMARRMRLVRARDWVQGSTWLGCGVATGWSHGLRVEPQKRQRAQSICLCLLALNECPPMWLGLCL